jgi:hypothetical protein
MSFEYLADASSGPAWKGLLPGDETEGQFGVSTGGFERFFQQMGQPTDHPAAGQPPFIPDLPRMQAAAQAHDMEFLPGFEWPAPPDQE